MNQITKEEKSIIVDNLKYIGLDLDNIPKILTEYKPIEFSPSRMYKEETHKVYKYISIKDIQIMLTPANKADLLKNRYRSAEPVFCYLQTEKEEDILKHSMFLNMVKNLEINKLEQVAKEQERLQNNIPFKVKYSKNYLWQIYYSEDSKQYFMLVSLEEKDNSSFFYLLKEQLKNSDKMIYASVNNLEYSTEYLKKSEIQDIEKYLWLFTKDWPITYEVIDRNNKKSLHFVGNSVVYEKIKSKYKIEIANKEDALKLYKLTKALFILQTELPHNYNFEVIINENRGLDFLYNAKLITYDGISKFIENEYKERAEELIKKQEELQNEEESLENLKGEVKETEIKYKNKEKEIATFLEYRKTFFGRIRYFFKKNKINKKIEKEDKIEAKEAEQQKENEGYTIQEKDYYTIEDLLEICKYCGKINVKLQNTILDRKALEYKLETIAKKLKNATQYIEEIDQHKKSLFEFWKFANKDNVLGLAEGETQKEEVKQKKMNKVFDYEEDFEELGVSLDKQQRKNLSKEECDGLYIATTDILKDLNELRQKSNIEKDDILNILKQEAQEQLLQEEEFDIFGTISEDSTKIKMLGNKKHRERKKERVKILNISKSTTKEEYVQKLKFTLEKIEKAIKSNNSVTDMSIYMAEEKVLNIDEFAIFNINPKNALIDTGEADKVNLYRINLKYNMPAVALSNIIFYDNTNKTLPVGMDEGDKILVDLSKIKLVLKRQKLFRINQEINEFEFKNKIICVYEYDVDV